MAKRLIDTVSGTLNYRVKIEAPESDSGLVHASFSSEYPVKRWFGTEVLLHDPGNVDLSRAEPGLPLLFGHDMSDPVGLIRNLGLKDQRLEGDMDFSPSARAQEKRAEVVSGHLPFVSIGYDVHKWEIDGEDDDVMSAIDWTPMEASIVSVPADHTVGPNRAVDMKIEHKDSDMKDFSVAFDAGKKEGLDIGVGAERTRIADIYQAFDLPSIPDTAEMRALRDTAIDQGWSKAVTHERILQSIGSGAKPAATGTRQQERGPDVESGNDHMEKWVQVVRKCILVRSSLEKDPTDIREARESGYYGRPLAELARDYLIQRGMRPSGDIREVVGQALTLPGVVPLERQHGIRTIVGATTSDFANILVSASNVAAQVGYQESPETWRLWAGIEDIADFRTAHFPQLSTFPDLDDVSDGKEYQYGRFSDFKETMTLGTFGKLFALTREAIINNDTRQFDQIPRHMGRAAARKVGDTVYSVLTTNGNMNDGNPLFGSAHSNEVADGSGGDPAVATLDAGFAAMGTQTDPTGNVLNIEPRYIITPKAHEATTRALLLAEFDPAIASGRAPNVFRGRLDGVYEPRLDADDAAQWYLASDYNMVNTVGVGLLNGIDAPFLEQESVFTVDGVRWKVRIDCAAAALDWRGLYQNDGN